MKAVNTEGAEGKGGLGGPEEVNRVTERIIGAAMRVHTAPGPGLLESAYELAEAGLAVERQRKLPITYGDLWLEEGYRLDLLVEKTVVVELKAIKQLRDIHEAQLLSHLRLSSCPVGLRINFHVPHLREGIRRVINTRR